MIICVNDYRGDDTVINSRGDSLYNYRTHYFHRIQQDFNRWQQWGHEFWCYTQHPNSRDFQQFDRVIPVERNPVAQAKNVILDDLYSQGIDWCGIWDNDSTLYWDKHRSQQLPKQLERVCELAQEQNIWSFVPFNPQQAPYQTPDVTQWTFKPTIQMKGSMTFLRVHEQRYNTEVTTMDDLVYAIDLTRQERRCGMLEQAVLNELVNGKSTIFTVNAYHEQYKNPGPRANPKGLLKWDAQLSRNEQYIQAHKDIEQLYGTSWGDWQTRQRMLWRIPETFNELFEVTNDKTMG